MDDSGLVLNPESELDVIRRAGSISFLLGAGISRTAGIPLASEIVAALGAELLGYSPETAAEKIWSELAAKPFFDADAPYASLLEARFPSQRARADYFEHLIVGRQPTTAHRCIAILLGHQYGSVACTTNFDRLMEYAILSECHEFPAVSVADSLPGGSCLESSRPRVLKLHGDYLYGNLSNLRHEMSYASASMQPKLELAAHANVMIVAGYSGGDASVMTVLEDLAERPDNFRCGIRWLLLRGTEPSPRVLKLLASMRHRGAGLLEVDGCDAFFTALSNALSITVPKSEPQGSTLEFRRPLSEEDATQFVAARLKPVLAREFSCLLQKRPDLGVIARTPAALDYLIARFEELGDLPRNLGEHIDTYVDLLAGACLPARSSQPTERLEQRLTELNRLQLAPDSTTRAYLEALKIDRDRAYVMPEVSHAIDQFEVLEMFVGLCSDATATIKVTVDNIMCDAPVKSQVAPWPFAFYHAARLVGRAGQIDGGLAERIVDFLLFDLAMNPAEPLAAIQALSSIGPRAVAQTLDFLLDDHNDPQSLDYAATVIGMIGNRDAVSRLAARLQKGSPPPVAAIAALTRTTNPTALILLKALETRIASSDLREAVEVLELGHQPGDAFGCPTKSPKQDAADIASAHGRLLPAPQQEFVAMFGAYLPAMIRDRISMPDDLGLLVKLGRSLRGSGKLAQAETLAREAIRRYPMLPLVYHDLALIYSRGCRPTAARRTYAVGVGLGPDYADYYNDFAVTLMRLKNYEAARSLLIQALSIDFENYRCWFNLAGVYSAPRDEGFTTVAEDFWAGSNISTHSGGVIWRPGLSGLPSYAQDASICLRRVLQLKPDHPTARDQLVALSPFVDHQMDGPPSLQQLAYALHLGEVTRPKHIDHKQLPPETAAAVLRSEKYILDGDFEAALRSQEEAYRLSPKSIGILHNLCILLGHTGKPDDAVRILEDALSVSPSNYDLILNYSFYLRSSARYDDAIRAAEKAIQVEPLSGLGWLALAEAYAHAGTRDQALDTLRTAVRMSGPWSRVLSHAADLAKKLGVQDILSF